MNDVIELMGIDSEPAGHDSKSAIGTINQVVDGYIERDLDFDNTGFF